MMRRLQQLLSESAARDPHALAVLEADGRAISYGDFDSYAGAIGEKLLALGVGPGDRVGICAPKTISALAAVFGALKAEAAYVPVDYANPPARNAFIFNDCSVAAIVVDTACADALEAELGGAWRRTDFPAWPSCASTLVLLAPDTAGQSPVSAPEGLAYILYTSGSTGRPKGVMHSHATALAFIDWCSDALRPSTDDRFSSHAPFHFDLSILDIYVPIKHGGAVVLIGGELGKQPSALAEVIEKRGISVWYSTPSILRMLVEHGDLASRDASALRAVIFAGEVFPVKHLRTLQAIWDHPTYYNLYGPTETNVCTFYKLKAPIPPECEALPIGRPCSGDRTIVVDPDGRKVARGGEGELLATGGSVMLGYWNLPERNEEAFVFIDGERWYRTGDVVREDDAGDYIFLGRRDRMVKRRGYRVELGEIEAALHRHPAISEAAALAVKDADGETKIRAFLTWSDTTPFSLIKMKQFCAQNLPLYMSPDQFTVLPALPKTSTDKVDYQRLRGMA